jgi:hypothetical protein
MRICWLPYAIAIARNALVQENSIYCFREWSGQELVQKCVFSNDMEQYQSEGTWGVHLNISISKQYRNVRCPSWASSAQRDHWKECGVVVWDETSQTVTRLWAEQALYLLRYLLQEYTWQDPCITIGEPATRLSLDDPQQPPQEVLINQIT